MFFVLFLSIRLCAVDILIGKFLAMDIVFDRFDRHGYADVIASMVNRFAAE